MPLISRAAEEHRGKPLNIDEVLADEVLDMVDPRVDSLADDGHGGDAGVEIVGV